MTIYEEQLVPFALLCLLIGIIAAITPFTVTILIICSIIFVIGLIVYYFKNRKRNLIIKEMIEETDKE